METCKGLYRKIHLFESMASEFHGLITMPINVIFQGIKLMDEKAETLWKCITDNFGHEFFIPIIDKLYSHLFVNDVSKHEAQMEKAIN